MQQSPHPKPQAASHMFWFFLIPAIGFVIWAASRLITGLVTPPVHKTVLQKVADIKDAKNSGDRWQAAYALAQELQQNIRSKNIDAIDAQTKSKLFSELHNLLKTHESDIRLKRYLLLTLGQIGDLAVLPALKESLAAQDEELRFFASWSYVDLLTKHPTRISSEDLATVRLWLTNPDPSLKKIGTAFLVQFGKTQDLQAVEVLLVDPNTEVRWNAATALGSRGHLTGKEVLKEMLNLEKLRSHGFRKAEDLQSTVFAAYQAAKTLNEPELLALVDSLRAASKSNTPEGAALAAALK